MSKPDLLQIIFEKKGEAFLSGIVKILLKASDPHLKLLDGLVPPIITAEQEFNAPRGRVDFLLVHDDGSATVCELKDGRNGLQSVLSGIGQVICYSIQVGMSNSGLTKIRKALLYSRTPKILDDVLIFEACLRAGVIPIPIGSEPEYRKLLIKPN